MQRQGRWISRLAAAGLLVGAVGCSSDSSDTGGPNGGTDGDIGPDDLKGQVASGLLRAEDCSDLLDKIQDDAVAKLDLTVELIKNAPTNADGNYADAGAGVGVGVDRDDAVSGGGDDGSGAAPPSAEDPGDFGGDGTPTGGDGNSAGGGGSGEGSSGGMDPTGSSNTNTQVEGVDEADFVKVVNNGKAMFVLHGNRLVKLKSWPADETALQGEGLEIEGSPSEMFVTSDRAVVFSSVYGYQGRTTGKGYYGEYDYCDPYSCGGAGFTKVTIADVSGAAPKTLRELYYEGYYVSSRRYGDVVRVIMQAQAQYGGLFQPSVQWQDPWGRPYSKEEIDGQLDEWRDRTAAAIRNTELSDWLPLVQEPKDGALAEIQPDCGSFYVPRPGLADYGLTHVLSLDTSDVDGDIGGVTIMGATSTVYSSEARLVLAQPDYRSFETDFGFVDQQQTALHVFTLSGASTDYEASGYIPGHLAGSIPQFAIDEHEGVIRAATTGWERVNPDAKEYSDEWWQTEPVNRVVTAQAKDGELKVIGESPHLGKPNETIRSSRFIGDRGYLVTAVQRDPLYVIDLSDAKNPIVLGEVEIPGFSEYVHPLDETHLVTIGQNASNWGIQLQMFDVSDPTAPKQTDVLDFGDGTYSEASYQHKAFTFFAEKKLLAVPVGGGYDQNGGFMSGLRVVRVDAKSGFQSLGSVDHSALVQAQTCGVCDGWGNCWEEQCASYAPEVRRGHFVSGDDTTYVYSFSYGGVLVNDVSDLDNPVATVELPSPSWDSGSWYGGKDGSGGSDGWGVGGGGAPDDPGVMPEPEPGWDAGSDVPVDGADGTGGSTDAQDGGVAMMSP